MNFYLKNGCKNEFKDNNEKSCSRSRNKISHKTDLKALWLRNGHADSVGVKDDILNNNYFILFCILRLCIIYYTIYCIIKY